MDFAPHKVDLHIHTTVSDGTDSPLMLLTKVRRMRMDVFSVTDHDAIGGCQEIVKSMQEGDPAFIQGAEFSARDSKGRYHILAYAYDFNAPSIIELAKLYHNNRMSKLDGRIAFLEQEYGFYFSQDEKDMLHSLSNPGKPHLGNLMTEHGYALDRNDAISNYINHYHGPELKLRPEEVITAILDAGGIPVLAHPIYGDGGQNLTEEQLRDRADRLGEMGLMGFECYYSGFNFFQQEMLIEIAREHGFYVSAGSDCHGMNKRISIGETGIIEDDQDAAANIRPLLEDAIGRIEARKS